MQAKSSVSDYRGSGKLSWVPRQAVAEAGGKKPKLVVVNSKSPQTNLKPGLY
jgi:hypothetical protein